MVDRDRFPGRTCKGVIDATVLHYKHARGNRAKAELWAKKALREDPAFVDAQQFLDELGGS